MPEPREGETRDAFMRRCIPMLVREGNPTKQAIAICLNMYQEARSKRVAEADGEKSEPADGQ